jgi:hypothetical protein
MSRQRTIGGQVFAAAITAAFCVLITEGDVAEQLQGGCGRGPDLDRRREQPTNLCRRG